MLNQDISYFENSVDPDQLASLLSSLQTHANNRIPPSKLEKNKGG